MSAILGDQIKWLDHVNISLYSLYYNITIKELDVSDSLILISLIESIYNYSSKHTNTKDKINIQDKILLYIHSNKHPHLWKNGKIMIKHKLDESYKDDINNVRNKNIKEKELRITNLHIKIYIL